MFDFSRQHVTRANVNIVGFFHPYCKMQGLSYCATYAVNGFSSVVLHYGCNVAALFSGGQRFELCESALRPFEKAAQVRTDIRARALAAPFWTNGGTLYIHTMLPHPPGNIAGNSLEVDYANNLQQAARFATDLIGRLETTFGQDYLLVITSDHPLRPTVWCGTYRYHEAGCLEGGRFNSTKVPLIAVGQGAHSLMDLQSNLDLLNRLTLIH